MNTVAMRGQAGVAVIAASTVAAGAQSTERCAQFCGLNSERTGYVCLRDCIKSAVDVAADPDLLEQQRQLRHELQRRADEFRNRLRSEPLRPTSE